MTTIFDLPGRVSAERSPVRSLGATDVVLPDFEPEYVVEWQVADDRASTPGGAADASPR